MSTTFQEQVEEGPHSKFEKHGPSYTLDELAEPYCHKPLHPARKEFRLMRLLPRGDEDQHLRCTLYHASLDDQPVYECLSYTWGDSKKAGFILIDGKPFGVTQNLETALRHLHLQQKNSHNGDRLLWIDAICIDQENDEERNYQVEQMFRIFSEAQNVLIWLGSESHDTDLAFKTVQQFSRELETRRVLPITWPYPDADGSAFQALQEAGNRLGDLGLPALRSLDSLFSRPWWRRVWVIQEAAVAKSAVVMCGPHTMPFELVQRFVNFVEWACNVYKTTAEFPSLHVLRHIYYHAVGICRHKFRADRPKPSLLHSIHNIYVKKEAQASDPRDRFFAILGLTNSGELGITVDYSKPCSIVYRDIAQTLIWSTGLLALSYCSGVRHNSSISVPSWVPDLTDRLLYPLGLDRRFQPLFSSSGSSRQPVRDASRHVHPDVLQLSAIWVGRIEATGRRANEQSPWEIHHFRHWIEDLESLAGEALGNAAQADGDELVWRTAIADNLSTPNGTRRRTKRSDAAAYEAFSLSIRKQEHESSDGELPQSSYRGEIEAIAPGRRGFRTGNGLVGIGKDSCQPGDDIYILLGHSTPFITRRGQSGQCMLIGEAYVHGIVDGELMDSGHEVKTLSIH